MHPASKETNITILDFKQLTRYISELGRARTAIHDANTPDLGFSEAFDALYDPRWIVHPEPFSGGILILFYHPGFGRLGFVLPHPEALKVTQAMKEHTDASISDKTKAN